MPVSSECVRAFCSYDIRRKTDRNMRHSLRHYSIKVRKANRERERERDTLHTASDSIIWLSCTVIFFASLALHRTFNGS